VRASAPAKAVISWDFFFSRLAGRDRTARRPQAAGLAGQFRKKAILLARNAAPCHPWKSPGSPARLGEGVETRARAVLDRRPPDSFEQPQPPGRPCPLAEEPPRAGPGSSHSLDAERGSFGDSSASAIDSVRVSEARTRRLWRKSQPLRFPPRRSARGGRRGPSDCATLRGSRSRPGAEHVAAVETPASSSGRTRSRQTSQAGRRARIRNLSLAAAPDDKSWTRPDACLMAGD